MKKNLLLGVAVAISITAFSQGNLRSLRGNMDRPVNREKINLMIAEPSVVQNPGIPSVMARQGHSSPNTITSVSVQTLGSAANAFGTLGTRCYLWADPELNTVVFSHRTTNTLPYNSGYLFYDVSVDGGATFDTTNGPVFDPTTLPLPAENPSLGRYPQCGIYNPPGNTTPANAYYVYYAAALDSTNPGVTAAGDTLNWGGNVHGSHKLDGTVLPTQHDLMSDAAARRFLDIPSGFHVCKNGKSFALSENNYGLSFVNANRAEAQDYTDTMIVSNGVWNSTNYEFDYTAQQVTIPTGQLTDAASGLPFKVIGGEQIAFNDDGTVGYIVVKLWKDAIEGYDTTYYMHIYKTTDGGATWARTSTPNFDYCDALLGNDSIAIRLTGLLFDLSVDANSNLHIMANLTSYFYPTTDSGFFYPYEGLGGVFDVFTTDGGATWRAHLLNSTPIQSLTGVTNNPGVTTGATSRLTFDNRPQISRSWDGTKLFFCWFETDTALFPPLYSAGNYWYANQHPDMRIVGYDLTTNMWTTERNVTAGTDADASCFYGMVSYYSLYDAGTGIHKIPAAYGFPSATVAPFNSPNAYVTFRYYYIDGVEIPDSAFTVAPVYPVNETSLSNNVVSPVGTLDNEFVVSNIYPNPFTGTATLTVHLAKAGDVRVDVKNLLGQNVINTVYKSQSSGSHKYILDGSHLSPGIYTYTVFYKDQQITKKMIIQ